MEGYRLPHRTVGGVPPNDPTEEVRELESEHPRHVMIKEQVLVNCG